MNLSTFRGSKLPLRMALSFILADDIFGTMQVASPRTTHADSNLQYTIDANTAAARFSVVSSLVQCWHRVYVEQAQYKRSLPFNLVSPLLS